MIDFAFKFLILFGISFTTQYIYKTYLPFDEASYWVGIFVGGITVLIFNSVECEAEFKIIKE